jgi:glycosyltransferase involved in cell wall biosynthesis
MDPKRDANSHGPMRGRAIRVGITEAHGMAAEVRQFSPPGVEYTFLRPTRLRPLVIRSPIKGYMRSYELEGIDIVEAVISPIVTGKPWIYSCANFQEATAVGVLGLPIPRFIRIAYIKHLLLGENCRKVIFWSKAGRETLQSYGRIGPKDPLTTKVTVIYPAVRQVPDHLIQFGKGDVTLLFSGDFFRKGGVNVIDAFERAHRSYPSLKLLLCCDENIDFNTPNVSLRREYLGKLRHTAGIDWLGRVSREQLIGNILPKTDVYLLPTYVETFGMAILESMAFGKPVIATNHFAIPEMITHDFNGLLIDTRQFNCESLFRGYIVRDIPDDFRKYVTEHLYMSICTLVESAETRRRLGLAGLERARTMFSFEQRNSRMMEIYRDAVEWEIGRTPVPSNQAIGRLGKPRTG